jgi:hypothetical protein
MTFLTRQLLEHRAVVRAALALGLLRLNSP